MLLNEPLLHTGKLFVLMDLSSLVNCPASPATSFLSLLPSVVEYNSIYSEIDQLKLFGNSQVIPTNLTLM